MYKDSGGSSGQGSNQDIAPRGIHSESFSNDHDDQQGNYIHLHILQKLEIIKIVGKHQKINFSDSNHQTSTFSNNM